MVGKKTMRNKLLIKKAFVDTVPVLAGYLVIGMGFGLLLRSHGFGVLWAGLTSVLICAGSLQFVAADLAVGGASLLTAALTAFFVNIRHLFYGISMIDKYKGMKKKPFLIFALTDETYSLVCEKEVGEDREATGCYYFWVSLFNYLYWIAGSMLGSVLGEVLPFSTEGVDFSLTALFLTVFTEQWLTTKNHLPALIGLGASVLSLLIFGKDNFLIFAMVLILASLALLHKREVGKHD